MKRTRSTVPTEDNITLEPVSKRGCFQGIESTHNGDLPLKTPVEKAWEHYRDWYKLDKRDQFALVSKLLSDNMMIWKEDLELEKMKLNAQDISVNFPDLNEVPTEEDWNAYYLSTALRYENQQDILDVEGRLMKLNGLEATMEKVYWALLTK